MHWSAEKELLLIDLPELPNTRCFGVRGSELQQLVSEEDQDEQLPCWERKNLPEIDPTALTIPLSGATCTGHELGKIAREKQRKGVRVGST